jgi:transcriptional regulator with XRE-family HTH domain
MLAMLREARESRGISQRALSGKVQRDHTHIVKIEKGVRRIDLIELIDICEALDLNVVEFVSSLMDSLSKGASYSAKAKVPSAPEPLS